MVVTLMEKNPEHIKVFADFDGHKINGQTIPQNIILTGSRTDLVIIDSSTASTTVFLFELTGCFERIEDITAANKRQIDFTYLLWI